MNHEMFCPKCHSVSTICRCGFIKHAEKKDIGNKPVFPMRKRGSGNYWIFIRNYWYNYFADKLQRCSLWYEHKENNIKNLNIGDKVIFYNKGEFIASSIISSVTNKRVRFCQFDCSVNKINQPDFSEYGYVIGLENIEVFEPDFTVDIHPILYKLKFIRGKKGDEELREFIESNKWGISLKTNIKRIDKEDYDLIMKTAQELNQNGMKRLETLREYLLKNGNSLVRKNMAGRLYELLEKPDWFLDSENYITENGIKILKQKLAKVGITFLDDDDYIGIVDFEDGEFLNGEGYRDLFFDFGQWEKNERNQKLSEIKEDIISGKIKNENGYLVRV